MSEDHPRHASVAPDAHVYRRAELSFKQVNRACDRFFEKRGIAIKWSMRGQHVAHRQPTPELTAQTATPVRPMEPPRKPFERYPGWNRRKVSSEMAAEIRERYRLSGLSQKKIAAEFGINQAEVCRIVNFKSHKISS